MEGKEERREMEKGQEMENERAEKEEER